MAGDDWLVGSIRDFYDVYHRHRVRSPDRWMQSNYWPAFRGCTLEVGGGTLFPRREAYTLVDISMVAVRRVASESIPALIADGAHLPFVNEAFDTVACFDVLEHVVHPVQFLAEMCRMARWRVVVAGPNYVGHHPGGMSRYLPLRWGEFLFGAGNACSRFSHPHLVFDEQWRPDRDAVSAPNAGWVAKQLRYRGFRISCLRTWETNYPWLDFIPGLRCLGTFMFVVGDKR